MSLLIIGGTGTLGRQIVLQSLTKGYKVRCMVRNFRKANFLREWGVELVYGDLTRPETLPPCLKGITCVIDVATSRPDELESLKKVDWDGKLSLIRAAEIAKVKRFIFFSVQNVERFQTIPLMKLKYEIEEKLKSSTIPYTIFRLTGFYQGLIEQYAIPTLENLPIWITNENTSVSYMDTQDIAKFCLRALQLPQTENQIYLLSGLKGWVSAEIISLTGFYQGLIEQYAIPTLENLPIWITNENTSVSYMDTQDIAKFCLRALQLPQTENQIYLLSGLKGWVSAEIISLCEQLAGQTANVQQIPVFALQLFSQSLDVFEWGQNTSDRLAFVEILNTENNFSKSTFDLYKLFKVEVTEVSQLDDYFLEYFVRLLKRLRDINFEDVQKQKNLVI